MATIQNIRQRAQELAEKWKSLSISPEEVGLLIDDLAAFVNDAVVNGTSLGIRKTYSSVSNMNADNTSPTDAKGNKIRFGQLVAISSSDTDNGKIYAFTDPGWMYVTTIDVDVLFQSNIVQETGSSKINVMSQDAVTKELDTVYESIGILEDSKQDKLKSGTNIKTVNNQSILGRGNIDIVTDSIPISGQINLAKQESYLTLTTIAEGLDNNTMKYYLITDSNGYLPSLTGETKITMYSTVGKLFHPSQNSVGASVGDIAVIAKINNVAVYYVQPRYEAKAPSGNFPGCDGLMSAGDKQNLTNAMNNSNTAIQQIDQSCFRCYNGTYNANNCFWYGYYMYVNFGRPAGSEDGENYLLRVADIGTTSDGKFLIEQTLYSSKYATKMFRRIITVTDKRGPADASNVVYTDWERIGVGANVVQNAGQSEEDVMSQKAVTNELNLKLNKAELENHVNGYIGDIDLIKSISVLEDYVINLEEGETPTLVSELNKPEFPVRKQLHKYAIGKIIIQETGYGDKKHTYYYWFIPVDGSHMGYSSEAVPFNVAGGVLFVCEPVIQSANPNANLRIFTGAASYEQVEGTFPSGDLIKDLVFSEYKIKSSNVVQVTGDSEENVMSQKAVTDALNKIQLQQGMATKFIDLTTLASASSNEEVTAILGTVSEFKAEKNNTLYYVKSLNNYTILPLTIRYTDGILNIYVQMLEGGYIIMVELEIVITDDKWGTVQFNQYLLQLNKSE